MQRSLVVVALSLVACSSATGDPAPEGEDTTAGETGGSAGAVSTGAGGAHADAGSGSAKGTGGIAAGGGGKGTGGGGATGSGGAKGSGGSTGGGGVTGNPTGGWVKASTGLAGLDSMCGSSGAILASPDEDRLYAQVALHGVFTSTDGGASWELLPGSTNVTNSGSAFTLDPANAKHVWEAGNHNSMSVFASQDGAAFDDIGQGVVPGADYLSVDFSDPSRKLMLTGPHEKASSLFCSSDGGSSWHDIGSGLPGGAYCASPLVVDASTYVVGCSNGDIQRTTNAGASWSRVSTGGTNRAPLAASDHSIYWVGGGGGVVRSADGGKTWAQALGNGKAQVVPPIELPDGRVAVVGTSGIVVTADQGASWVNVTTAPKVTPWTFTYSKHQKAFFAAYGVCAGSNAIPDDVVTKYAFDYQK